MKKKVIFEESQKENSGKTKLNDPIGVINSPPKIPTKEYEEIREQAYREGVKAAMTEQVKEKLMDSSEIGKEEGIIEGAREAAKKEETAREKLSTVAAQAENILLKIRSVFPLDLFPSTLIIDTTKITVITKAFFASETVRTILLKEVTDVSVETNLFFARLLFTYSHNPIRPMDLSVGNFKKNEALKAKDIIQGVMVLRLGENVDLTNLSAEKILNEIKQIGYTQQRLTTIG